MRPECIPIWIEQSDAGPALACALNTSNASGIGETVGEAVDNLRRDLTGTQKWLASHGVADDNVLDVPFRIVETIKTNSHVQQGKSKAFFDWDTQRLSNQEINRAETILQCSRSDLLSLFTPATKETLDLRLAPKTRTIREILLHVASMELGYANNTLDDPMGGASIFEFGPDLITRLTLVRGYFTDHCFRRLRLMGDTRRMRQQLIDQELWTARKALRLAVRHEVYHLKQIYRMLTRIRRLPDRVRRAAVA